MFVPLLRTSRRTRCSLSLLLVHVAGAERTVQDILEMNGTGAPDRPRDAEADTLWATFDSLCFDIISRPHCLVRYFYHDEKNVIGRFKVLLISFGPDFSGCCSGKEASLS